MRRLLLRVALQWIDAFSIAPVSQDSPTIAAGQIRVLVENSESLNPEFTNLIVELPILV
jgi:hypothetical protein